MSAADALRHGGRARLAQAMAHTRAQTLARLGVWRAALPPAMEIRYAPELNPPRWEFGHVAWFAERWLVRNPLRRQGAAADPDVARAASLLPGADALYDSSAVAHTRRWHLDLPDAERTLRYAAQVQERTLQLLAHADEDDDALYFFRLVLAHEAMHAEASVYMAQHLALPMAPVLARAGPAGGPPGEIECAGGELRLGQRGPGFFFDNESGHLAQELAAFTIDRCAVCWSRYRPFIEAGGYDDPRWWTPAGWAWRQQHSNGCPRHLQCAHGRWQRAAFGRWQALGEDEPVMHLSQHEAQAWCRWAGRRLPTEAEWQWAASHAEGFVWGEVWEWTASEFAPWPGFAPHPYRDYSQPWFDGRPVLRGASFATLPCLAHRHYRNYFPAGRSDLFVGFRSCAA